MLIELDLVTAKMAIVTTANAKASNIHFRNEIKDLQHFCLKFMLMSSPPLLGS